MKLLQINSTLNTTSTGRIAEEIGLRAIERGYESYAACYRLGDGGSSSNVLEIGSSIDRYLHGIKTRMIDRHGFGSKRATLELVEEIRAINPDVIGLHNLHGYYLNIEVLFNYLKEAQKPVIWTFHDCWPFTGHCSYFDRFSCEKWKKECHDCPMTTYYPASYGLDQSNRNFHDKKQLFTGLDNLTIVTPSHWLKGLVKESFLKEYPVEVIHNGIDLDVFKPGTDDLPEPVRKINEKMILGVASIWDDRKGLKDFLKLSELIPDEYKIVLVGLDEKQLKQLPENILGMARTENVQQLASIYSAAEAFVNPTWSDNFPTTNIEALACGTPVITYDTGGSPEAADRNTGFVIKQGDLNGIVQSLKAISEMNRESNIEMCRNRAVEHYNKEHRFRDYVELYSEMLGEKVVE
jgi:glycosyltransferase involved in cell wall biosynthesis